MHEHIFRNCSKIYPLWLHPVDCPYLKWLITVVVWICITFILHWQIFEHLSLVHRNNYQHYPLPLYYNFLFQSYFQKRLCEMPIGASFAPAVLHLLRVKCGKHEVTCRFRRWHDKERRVANIPSANSTTQKDEGQYQERIKTHDVHKEEA